jgi:hypothetical protein
MCKKLIFVITLVTLLAPFHSALADTYTWTNDYLWSVLWDDALNWDPPGVPGASDEALISPPPQRGPAIDSAVYIGDIHGPRWDSDSNQVVDIVGGTVVVNGQWMWCNSGSGTGTINITGSPDITFIGLFGGVYSGTGILNISDGPTITSNSEWRMVDGNDAVGIFNIGGSPDITIHGQVRLADNGLAILNITGDPTIIIDGDLTAGYNSGGTLQAHISGGSLSVGGSFQIGDDGSGVIDVNGGTVSCRIFRLQVRPDNATATFNMSDGDVYVEESLRICDGNGTATMNMSGGDVNTNELWLPGGDGIGILNMTGGLLKVRGAMLAPRDSAGTCIINLNGGLIKCRWFAPGGPYAMDIEGGTLVIDGDVRDVINADVAAGYITAYGGCNGRGDVKVDFDNVNPGETTVWAVPVLERAWDPWPGCDAQYIPEEVVLRWSPGDGATTHVVWFGTSFDDVNEGGPSVFKGFQSGTTYNAGTLSFGQTYYWRIDEMGDSYTPGLVWSFTLGDIIVVDDMESYTPGRDSPNAICNEWIDGYTNWTGSLVFLGIAPAAPVHGGEQSMMYFYANDFDNGAGYYSEIEREYPDPCDWTAVGVKALTLYFYGDPSNDATATERMYVGLEDSSSSYAEVKYGDNGEDMNDVKIEDWQEWNIALQDFNDGGVNLTEIKKVYIGFGNKVDPFMPGGLGLVYFDDITVYPIRCVADYGPVGDVSGDCVVDFKDVEIMADEWLDSGDVAADLYTDGKVDFKDYAVLADSWLEIKLWPSQ